MVPFPGRERLRDRELVGDVAVHEEIDEVDPLLALDREERLEALRLAVQKTAKSAVRKRVSEIRRRIAMERNSSRRFSQGLNASLKRT